MERLISRSIFSFVNGTITNIRAVDSFNGGGEEAEKVKLKPLFNETQSSDILASFVIVLVIYFVPC